MKYREIKERSLRTEKVRAACQGQIGANSQREADAIGMRFIGADPTIV